MAGKLNDCFMLVIDTHLFTMDVSSGRLINHVVDNQSYVWITTCSPAHYPDEQYSSGRLDHAIHSSGRLINHRHCSIEQYSSEQYSNVRFNQTVDLIASDVQVQAMCKCKLVAIGGRGAARWGGLDILAVKSPPKKCSTGETSWQGCEIW